MTIEQAELTIRSQMAQATGSSAKAFWKGVLVGIGCGANLNFNVELMKDIANRQGSNHEPVAYP